MGSSPIFSTAYFGEIPYFQSLLKYDEVLIDSKERYKKQSWRNRTCILSSNGPLLLSVPVIKPNGSLSIVEEISISYDTNWQKDHWKAIESAYTHAPYFFYYGEMIKDIIYAGHDNLLDYNIFILKKILNWLSIEIEVDFSSEYFPPKDKTDYRVLLGEKKFNIKQESYIQVFSDKLDFYPNLSILDLLMNQGPMARKYLGD